MELPEEIIEKLKAGQSKAKNYQILMSKDEAVKKLIVKLYFILSLSRLSYQIFLFPIENNRNKVVRDHFLASSIAN